MIEILRNNPHPSWILLLFLFIVLIYVVLYISDPRRVIYFFRSFYNKQYQVTYGRQLKLMSAFMASLSLCSLLTIAFILYNYLSYNSCFVASSTLFLSSVGILFIYMSLKWVFVFIGGLLFQQGKIVQDFALLSIHNINLFIAPISLLTIYLYLRDVEMTVQLNILAPVVLLIWAYARVKSILQLKKSQALVPYYLILYICTFEIAPVLWALYLLRC